MIVITDPHVYRQLRDGQIVTTNAPLTASTIGARHFVGEPWAIRNLGFLYAIEYLLTSESFFVSREDLEALALPAETWHPAETLPEWGARLWAEVQTVAGTTVTVHATKGTRR
jgi:hypothetical protein